MRDFLRWYRRGIPIFPLTQTLLVLFGLSLFLTVVVVTVDVLLLSYTPIPPDYLIYRLADLGILAFPWISAAAGLGAMAVMGLFRSWAHHPFANRGYLVWLQATPWTPGDPLPMGPLGVTTQDCVTLAAVSLLIDFFTPLQLFVTPMIFLLTYSLSALRMLFLTREKGYSYAVAFGLGIPVGLLAWPWASLAALVALYGIARRGLERSLQRFPWEPDADAIVPGGAKIRKQALLSVGIDSSKSARQGTLALSFLCEDLGWPLGELRSRWRRARFSRIDALLLALLPGFYICMYILASRTPVDSMPEGGGEISSPLGVLFFLLAVIRLAIYGNGRASPISPLGRIVTGRLIIPRFDVIFVTPLAAFLAGMGVARVMESYDFDAGPISACAITVFLLILLNGGPSISRWRLTGAYRSHPKGVTTAPGFVKL